MSTKRSHSKSRTGCKQCKARRIKCDETPPCCHNCAKRGSECEYQDFKDAFENIRLLTPASFVDKGPGAQSPQGPPKINYNTNNNNFSGPSSSSPVESRSGSAGFESSQSFNIADLGYMHFWSLYTYQTMPMIYDEYHQGWQYQVPRMALSNPDLMHGLLALAAAHQQSMIPAEERDPQQINEVRQHYSKALNYFLSRGRNIRGEDAEALLYFVSVMSVLTVHLEQQKPAEERNAVSEFLALAHVVRATMGMLHPIEQAMKATSIGALFLRASPASQRCPLDSEIFRSLDKLDMLTTRYLESAAGKQEDHNVVTAASSTLRDCLCVAASAPVGQRCTIPWLTGLGPEFYLLLQQRHPMALLIVAHWCVATVPTPTYWWTGAWSSRMLAEIQQEVNGTEWADGLGWPLQQVFGIDGL